MRPKKLNAASRREAAGARTWSVDIAGTSMRIDTHPNSRVAIGVVTAGSLVVAFDLVLDGPNDAEGVAAAMCPLLEAAAANVTKWPRRVAVRHASVALALRPAMQDRGVEVVDSWDLPDVDRLLESMGADTDMGSFDGGAPATWQAWALAPGLVAELFVAAAAFFRARPWEYMESDGFVEFVDGADQWYATVLGGTDGVTFGMAVFDDKQTPLAMITEPGAEGQSAIKGPMISLLFEESRHLPPGMGKEVRKQKWEVAGPEAYPMLFAIRTIGGGVTNENAKRVLRGLRSVTHFILDEEASEHFDPWEATEWTDAHGVRARYSGNLTYSSGRPSSLRSLL